MPHSSSSELVCNSYVLEVICACLYLRYVLLRTQIEKICGNTDVILCSRNTYMRRWLECGDIQYIVRKSDKISNVDYQPGSAVN